MDGFLQAPELQAVIAATDRDGLASPTRRHVLLHRHLKTHARPLPPARRR
jgi:hypothetical protein